jgi:hypothetical protein
MNLEAPHWSGLFGGAGGASIGAYSRTPEGIATAAAFLMLTIVWCYRSKTILRKT